MIRTTISHFIAFFLALFAFVSIACRQSTEPITVGVDTTSHNFTWQVERFGDGSSSVLYDVAIVNDTLAYAVGEIYLKDSSGVLDPILYNFAIWDGKQWTITRQASNAGIGAIWAFSENDFWVGTGGPYRWDGTRWTPYPIAGVFSGRVHAFWGTNSTDLYMVGDNGSIAHFDGIKWTKTESGTTLTIQDIWGAKDPTTGTLEIIAVASEPFYASRGRRILRVSGTTVTTLSDSGITQTLTGVWFSASRGYYVSGGGIFGKNGLNDIQWLNGLQGSGITIQYLSAIRGNAVNDIFAVGSNGDALHFNGISWRNFRDQTALTYGDFHAVAVRGDLVCAVGEDLSRAVIAIGRRQR